MEIHNSFSRIKGTYFQKSRAVTFPFQGITIYSTNQHPHSDVDCELEGEETINLCPVFTLDSHWKLRIYTEDTTTNFHTQEIISAPAILPPGFGRDGKYYECNSHSYNNHWRKCMRTSAGNMNFAVYY